MEKQRNIIIRKRKVLKERKIQQGNERKARTCNQCSLEFVHEQALRQHFQAKHVFQIQCRYCDRIFQSEQSLRQHGYDTGHY